MCFAQDGFCRQTDRARGGAIEFYIPSINSALSFKLDNAINVSQIFFDCFGSLCCNVLCCVGLSYFCVVLCCRAKHLFE